MTPPTVNIVIGGQAGQGMVTIGQLLATGLVRSGYFIFVTQDYQSRIRGGHNSFTLRVGVEDIAAPQSSIDLLIALDSNTVELYSKELSSAGVILMDDRWKVNRGNTIKVPYAELAPEKSVNILALGVAGALLGLEEECLIQAVEDQFGHKDQSITDQNREALEKAYQWTRDGRPNFPRLPRTDKKIPRFRLNGNEAIALGALSAGVKFLSFYPMTPATSIALTLAAHAETMGLIVEQAEDEIAAVNMAIGASFSGAPSMVSTSGGGFALMVEGVSLAGMTETPLVIVVAQRPGPATGLPTRTEQADLEFILHAGHGEFPRAVLTPGSVEECFFLIRKAFELAENFQTPIFLLTDQFLADSYRAVKPFDGASLSSLQPGSVWSGPAGSYGRYHLTESGLSPRLLPGATAHLVVADSDEHNEDGHLTEDLTIRKKMVEKRLKKGVSLTGQAIPPEYKGESNPELLLVTWGSSKGSVLEAADQLQKLGKKVGTLCFSQVWPMDPNLIHSFLEPAKEVIGVEGNATGQLCRLIRRETGFHIRNRVLRYDGLPITPETIIHQLGFSEPGD
jgi:2-oxoglutarate/2-oxoacid ferredoxin oxidoreductase subunit alpha